MSDQEYLKVFSTNLKRFINQYEMTYADLAKRLNVSAQSVSYWVNGQKAPRMDKVDMMCDIFHCRRADLMEEATEEYYIDPKTAEIAQEIKDSKELTALFDVGRKMSPEDLQTIYQLALALKRKEQG